MSKYADEMRAIQRNDELVELYRCTRQVNYWANWTIKYSKSDLYTSHETRSLLISIDLLIKQLQLLLA